MEDKYYTHFEHHYTQIIWKPVPEELEALKRKVFKPESNQLNGIVSVSVFDVVEFYSDSVDKIN